MHSQRGEVAIGRGLPEPGWTRTLPSRLGGNRAERFVNPAAVEAGAAARIEVAPGPGLALSNEVAASADLIVTFGGDVGDLKSDAPIEDWQALDDSGRPLKDYDSIRDAITQPLMQATGRFFSDDYRRRIAKCLLRVCKYAVIR